MKYYSTNRNSPIVDFKDATIKGQAPDKGLYFPERIPVFEKKFIKNIHSVSKEELAFQIIQPYIGDCIPAEALYNIVSETIAFDFPLIQLDDSIYVLELFHGPTLAFKDVGARFMSRCLGYFSTTNAKKTTVLVATSGDTGGAVANGFLGVEGVEVVILYPAGKVSPVQEMQLTTCGHNISALKVNGNFDDCQAMVKEAFMDKDLNATLQLTSANSINVARWLPQQLYYFFALQQWSHTSIPPVVSVPSGNLGNIAAGLLAMKSGLDIASFIAACNINNTISGFLDTGIHTAIKTKPTISNAMDVGSPSNLIRIIEMYQSTPALLKEILKGVTRTDQETISTIQSAFQQFNYILDPHGAVGYAALKASLKPEQKGFFLATAHPVKFPETVEKVIETKLAIPDAVKPLFSQPPQFTDIDSSFERLKEWLLNR